jgi:hypothetical protein
MRHHRLTFDAHPKETLRDGGDGVDARWAVGAVG